MDNFRGNFVNIDLAHRLCCDKLERGVQRMRLQKTDIDDRLTDARRYLTEMETGQAQAESRLVEECERVLEMVGRVRDRLLGEAREACDARWGYSITIDSDWINERSIYVCHTSSGGSIWKRRSPAWSSWPTHSRSTF